MNREGETKRRQDERITSALRSLRSVVDNKSVPRNIRRVEQHSLAMLRNSELSVAVRAANMASMLEGITSDYNAPSLRVAIWSAISN